MCGIAGILNVDGDPVGPTTVAQQMASSIEHRGPDDEGLLTDGPVAFGFRRLCIIDLATGHQRSPTSKPASGAWRAQWFQQPQWRALLVDMLAEERLRSQGIFNPPEVLRLRDWLLDDPEAVRRPMSAYQLRHQVWALLVFQIWHDQFMGQSG